MLQIYKNYIIFVRTKKQNTMDFVKIPTTSKPTFQFVPEAQLRGQQLRDFVFAGNALFTILNKESGNYITYKVKKHKEDDIWFVSTLSGHNHVFIGTCFSDKNFKYSASSVLPMGDKKVATFIWFLQKFFNDQNKYPMVEVYHHGRCGHCYKTLTTPESIKTGIGPVCSGKKYKKVTR
jgi:hypothetical protein